MNDYILTGALSVSEDIADALISRIIIDDKGDIYWNCMGPGSGTVVTWQASEDLYSGVAGISLYFASLYDVTKQNKYREVAEKSVSWLIRHCDANESNNYALYTGRTGVALAICEIGELLQNVNFKKAACNIIKDCHRFIESKHVSDLLNGLAGTILGLMHIHARTKESWLIDHIYAFTVRLIEETYVTTNGFFWDPAYNKIRGLCGFSHGVSGIGYVFLELGNYFKNETFFWIARRAFGYEGNYFDPKKCNWPDFRKNYFDAESKQKFELNFQLGNDSFFFDSADASAWCHGAPGIGLVRLRAIELLGDDQFHSDLENAIKKTFDRTIASPWSGNFTLCHGRCGNMTLLLEADKFGKYDHGRAVVEEFLTELIAHKRQHNRVFASGLSADGTIEDNSLFNGITGIGYFLLLAAFPSRFINVLRPDVPTSTGVHSDRMLIGQTTVNSFIFNRLYPRTYENLDSFSWNDRPDNLNEFHREIEKRVYGLGSDPLSEIFSLERAKLRLNDSVRSLAYVGIVRETNKNKYLLWKHLTEQQKLNSCVELDRFASCERYGESSFFLLLVTAYGVSDFTINKFGFEVINRLKSSRRIQSLIDEFVAEMEIESEHDHLFLKNQLLNQIDAALDIGAVYVL